MPNYYRFSPEGLLEPCQEHELERTGGQRHLSEKQVLELSGGKHSAPGWIAAIVQGPLTYGSDDLGTKGVFNPADGKTYDSKSAYYRAVKNMGLEIVGNDAPTQRATPKTKEINWEKAVAETLKTTPLKGKKR